MLRKLRKRLHKHKHKLIVTQADKVKAVVTIDVNTYQQKIGVFLTEIFFLSVPVTGPFVAQRVGRGIALLFHDRDTRRG